jgi:hypothetical protein
MTTFVEPFFQVDENATALRHLLSTLPNQKTSPEDPAEVAPYLRQVIRVLLNNAVKFDESCQINIKWIGSAFISSARSYQPDENDSKNQRIDLFTSAYRFLCELEFSVPESLSMELRAVKNFVDDNIDGFRGQFKSQLIYANYVMPAQIAKEMLHHPNMAAIREFNAGQKSAQSLKLEWDKEFDAKKTKVESLKNQLDGLETGFNFVGLVDGFRRLSEQKIKEKKFAFACLLGLGACVLAPIIGEGVFIFRNLENLDKYKSAALFVIPPLVALELLLVYFFRVVLIHFKSIKAQLLQIELRTALCQFIQSYSTYAAQIKEKSSSALDKFESLIFSGLISNEENLPSTFDGTDQLAKLIGGLRK